MDFDKLFGELEKLNKNIERAQKSLDAEIEKGNNAQQEITEIDQELQSIFEKRRTLETKKWSLQQEQKTAARKIDVIGKLLDDLKFKKNGLNAQMTALICRLADEKIKQADGIYELSDKIGIARLKVGDRFVTRLVPVSRSRAGPG